MSQPISFGSDREATTVTGTCQYFDPTGKAPHAVNTIWFSFGKLDESLESSGDNRADGMKTGGDERRRSADEIIP
jgi:hypothetical protein